MRKVLSICICLLLLMGCSQYVFAQSGDTDISTLMEYIASSKVMITVADNGVATISCRAYGHIGTTTHIEIVAVLQRYTNDGWSDFRSFTAESDSYMVFLDQLYALLEGYSYRVQAIITVYCGNETESDVVTSHVVTY